MGMGKDFYDHFSFARETYDQANEILGWDIAELSFSGPKEELTLTSNTQPAIMVHSYIAQSLLRENGVEPVLAMGNGCKKRTGNGCKKRTGTGTRPESQPAANRVQRASNRKGCC